MRQRRAPPIIHPSLEQNFVPEREDEEIVTIGNMEIIYSFRNASGNHLSWVSYIKSIINCLILKNRYLYRFAMGHKGSCKYNSPKCKTNESGGLYWSGYGCCCSLFGKTQIQQTSLGNAKCAPLYSRFKLNLSQYDESSILLTLLRNQVVFLCFIIFLI